MIFKTKVDGKNLEKMPALSMSLQDLHESLKEMTQSLDNDVIDRAMDTNLHTFSVKYAVPQILCKLCCAKLVQISQKKVALALICKALVF